MDNLEKEFDFFKKKENKKLSFFKKGKDNIAAQQEKQEIEIDYLGQEFSSSVSIVCNYYFPFMILLFVLNFLEIKQLDNTVITNIFHIWKSFFSTFLIAGLFIESAKKIITMKDFASPVKYLVLLLLSNQINDIIENIFRSLIRG